MKAKNDHFVQDKPEILFFPAGFQIRIHKNRKMAGRIMLVLLISFGAKIIGWIRTGFVTAFYHGGFLFSSFVDDV